MLLYVKHVPSLNEVKKKTTTKQQQKQAYLHYAWKTSIKQRLISSKYMMYITNGFLLSTAIIIYTKLGQDN